MRRYHRLFLYLLTLSSFVPSLYSTITPYGNIGDPPLFIVDAVLAKNKIECIYFYGDGNLTDAFIQVYFEQFNEIQSQASDLLFSISSVDSITGDTQDCVMQGGYNNYMIPKCQYLTQWNTSWYQQADILVHDDVIPPENYVYGKNWSVCLGNGWAGSEDFVRYQALIVLFGIQYFGYSNLTITKTFPPTLSPTSSPTLTPTILPNDEIITYPISHVTHILSNCNDKPIIIQHDITLAGHEKTCKSFFSSGLLSSIKVKLNYTLHSSSILSPQDIYQGISDLAITLINTQQQKGIQIGGIFYLHEMIDGFVLSWPEIFYNLDISSNSHEVEIAIPLQNSHYLLSPDEDMVYSYELCLHNSYQSDSSQLVNYQTLTTLIGMKYNCDVTIETFSPTTSPTPSPSPPLPSSNIQYSSSSDSILLSIPHLYLQFDSKECLNLVLGGTLSSLHFRLSYHGNNVNWASDILLSLEDDQDGVVSCHQIEGLTASFELPNCEFISYWPNELNQISNGFYEGIIDLPQPIVFSSYSNKKICFTSTQDSSTSRIFYNGTILFYGIQTSPDPTSSPTIYPISRSVIAPYLEDDAVLIGLILIPIIIVIFIATMSFIYCHRKKQGVYKQIAIPDGNIFIIEDDEGTSDVEKQSHYLQSTVIDAHQHQQQQQQQTTSQYHSITGSPMKSMSNWLVDLTNIFTRERSFTGDEGEDSWHNQITLQGDSLPVKTIQTTPGVTRLQNQQENRPIRGIIPKSLSLRSGNNNNEEILQQSSPRLGEEVLHEISDDEEEENRKLSQINRNMLLRSTSKSKIITQSSSPSPSPSPETTMTKTMAMGQGQGQGQGMGMGMGSERHLEEMKQVTPVSLHTPIRGAPIESYKSSPPLPQLKSLQQNQHNQQQQQQHHSSTTFSSNSATAASSSGGILHSFWSIFQGKRDSAISLQEMSARPKTSPPSHLQMSHLGVNLDEEGDEDEDEEEEIFTNEFISPNMGNSPIKIPPPLSPPTPAMIIKEDSNTHNTHQDILQDPSFELKKSPLGSPLTTPRNDKKSPHSSPVHSPGKVDPTFEEFPGMMRRKSTPSPTISRRPSSGDGENSVGSGVWATMSEKLKSEKRLKILTTPKTSPAGEYIDDVVLKTPSPVTSPDWFDKEMVFSDSTPSMQGGRCVEEVNEMRKLKLEERVEDDEHEDENEGGMWREGREELENRKIGYGDDDDEDDGDGMKGDEYVENK